MAAEAARTMQRRLLPLGILVVGGIWIIVSNVVLPTFLAGSLEGAVEFTFVAIAALLVLIVGERDETARAQHATALAAAEARQRLLAAAVDQTAESLVICDTDGAIVYANPAFEQVSGYPIAEVLGRNPRFLASGLQSAAFYRKLWSTITSGHTWSGEIVNRRRDGGLYTDESTITPIRDDDGRIIRYVAVQRNVSRLRALEANLASVAHERVEIASSLARLAPGGSLEETASAICEELARLPGVDFAALNVFEGVADVVTVGVAGSKMPVGTRLPAGRARRIRERASLGAWVESWQPEPTDGPFGRAVTSAGVRAVAIGPISNGAGPVGMLLVGATTAENAEHLVERLPALVEFAATTSGLIGDALLGRREQTEVRERIERIVTTGAFHPVYQPIVELAGSRVIGYEALMRFDDGTPPDELFGAAARTGAGPALERATLEASLAGSRSLPDGAWLSLNVSPAFAVSGDLRAVLASRPRSIVVEITEHERIADYGAIRDAIAALGADVRVAVDDAGAGIANFGHIVELRPDYLKLDATLVRDIDADSTRQGLVVGLLAFAQATGTSVIAEGIASVAELATLRSLGVGLGQGYLLGMPEPAPAPVLVAGV